MRFLLRLLTIVAALLMLRSLLAPLVKAIAGWIRSGGAPSQTAAAGAAPGPSAELKKDPVCGAFVSTELAVTKKVNGQTLHFCSQKCRDEYSRTA